MARLFLATILTLAVSLALVHGDASGKGRWGGYATECVTVERTYQDGTSEINRYGVCATPTVEEEVNIGE